MSYNGAVIYRGPSAIDGKPIVVIVTGLESKSTNGKTGDLLQTWILREDISPADAVNTGEDFSICGSCPHRGTIVDGKNVNRSCYVKIFQAPRNVWSSYHRGIYPTLTMEEVTEAFAGRKVRLGAYGDPAAMPFDLWAAYLSRAKAFTGYTHQWRYCDPRFARFVMASCDSHMDHVHAKREGYRTFRIRLATEGTLPREVICPASKEAGVKTNCAACLACGGNSAKAKADIVIIAHGNASVVNAFTRLSNS